MSVAEQRAKQGLPPLGKKSSTPTTRSSGGGGGGETTSPPTSGKETIVEERRGSTVIIEKKDGNIVRRTYIPKTFTGRPIAGSITPTTISRESKTEVIEEPAGPRRSTSPPPSTPVMYGPGYDPIGVSFARTGVSKISDKDVTGAVGRYDIKTYYPGRQDVYTTKTGTVVQTRTQVQPAPEVKYEDTPLGRMYGKALRIEEMQQQASARAERTKEFFDPVSYGGGLGTPGSFTSKMTSYALATPTLFSVGLGEQVFLAGTKIGFFGEALSRKETRKQAIQELTIDAPKRVPKELAYTFNPTSPEGIVNIAIAVGTAGAIGRGRAITRGTTPEPGSIEPLGSRSYTPKGGETINVQKGTYTSISGKQVRYEVRSTPKDYVLRLKKPSGELISQTTGRLSQNIKITPKQDAYGQTLEGYYEFGGTTTYRPKGRLKVVEQTKGELRLGREKNLGGGRTGFEETTEFITTTGRKGYGGLEVSRVTKQGGITQVDISKASFGKVTKPLRPFGKRGELSPGRPEILDFGDFAGTIPRTPDVSPPFVDVFARPTGRFRARPESLVRETPLSRVGAKPATLVEGGVSSQADSIARSISSAFSRVSTGTKNIPKIGIGTTGLTTGLGITDNIVVTGVDVPARTITSSFGSTGEISTPRPTPPPPPPPPPPGLPFLWPKLPAIPDIPGKKKGKRRGKKKSAYTPSFSTIARESILEGTKPFKTPKLKKQKVFTGFEIRGR